MANDQPQVILFPVQTLGIHEPMPFVQQVFQCRLDLIREINLLNAGTITYNDLQLQRLKRNIVEANPFFIKYGYSALRLDF